MAARAMWKGQLVMGDVDVPVKLFSAVQGQDVHFRLLHEKDQQPVKQEMVNPKTGKIVPYEKIGRAYQTESGDLILLSEEELALADHRVAVALRHGRMPPPGTARRNADDTPGRG